MSENQRRRNVQNIGEGRGWGRGASGSGCKLLAGWNLNKKEPPVDTVLNTARPFPAFWEHSNAIYLILVARLCIK